ncbi:hypothetical protein HA402_008212 [Bradysia odoriphaga]|nr:hypothetical protein HA402_008212 [Bradysia odoriphaga]
MTVRIVIIAIKLMAISSCSADFNIFSIITKAYESNVKSLRNFFHLSQDHSHAFIYDNDISDNEVDSNRQNYGRKDDLYSGVYQYDDYYANLIPDSNEDVYTPLTTYEDDQENRSNNLGFFNTILKLIGYRPPKISIQHVPIKMSNRTKGLDVRLKSSYFTQKLLKTMKSQFKLIYPGTLWCGGGTLARDSNDYGFFRRTDKCCWKHDSCPKYIAGGEKWKNLENVGIFTRSHCECDRDFYTCLKGINSFVSNKIGVTYFNLLRPQCFRKEYPIVSCLERRSDSRCFNYVIDNNKPKQWQWFDNKIY